jgi:hypothetical protein
MVTKSQQIVFVARRLFAARLYEFVSRIVPALHTYLVHYETVPAVTAWPSRLPLRIFNGSFTNDVIFVVSTFITGMTVNHFHFLLQKQPTFFCVGL